MLGCITLPIVAQDFMGGLLIATLGILHGANDIAIIQKHKIHRKTLSIVTKYSAVVLLGGIVFFYLPALALLSFVLVSAYHFGEQHLASRYNIHRTSSFVYFVYGSLVFALLFFFHQLQVQEVVQIISNINISDQFFIMLLGLAMSLFLSFWLLKPQLRKNLVYELFLFAGIIAVFSRASLIYAFGFYFVVWHSYPSLKSQINFLYDSQLSSNPFRQYLRSSFWYWIAALLGLIAGYLWIDFSAQYFLPLFFTFLAAITFPHVLVMQQMFHSKK